MRISDEGLQLIRQFESLRLEAYQDSVGVWTVGFGHTKGVRKGDGCNEEQAEEWLKDDAHVAENCVNACVSVPMTQGEFDGLTSFVFNLGCSALRNSTLLRRLNNCDYDGAAAEFARWNHAGGKVLAGLTSRREAETARFEA